MIQTIYDNGEDYQITSKMDSAVYSVAIADSICKGVGDEFSYTASGRTLTFASGSECVIGGGFLRLTGNESITLPANSTVYLCASIDTSKQDGQKGSLVARASQSEIRKDNLNGNQNAVRDILLYIIRTNSSGIASVQDKREIRGDGQGSTGTINWQVLTEAQYNALSTKEANTIYFIYEA